MVMLQKELEADKEVYILDEPERSLGNEYINDVIVPLIKDRARAGKKVFISTHDANIAVRTLPYCSVYRCHEPNGYATYIGNPFSNDLVNPKNKNDTQDWRKISMRTLEGGKKHLEREVKFMEIISAKVIEDDEAHFIEITTNETIRIPLSEDSPNTVKSAFNQLIERIKEGNFEVKLEDVGDDLFSQVAQEYIAQLNREIQEVRDEMITFGLIEVEVDDLF